MFYAILSVLSDNLTFEPFWAYWINKSNKTTFAYN